MSSLKANPGTRPPGTLGEVQAAVWVQRMFGRIAFRYDLLNHLLSFNIDRSWRRLLLRRLQPVLRRPEAIVLDLCCGTGDVLLAFKQTSAARLLGADFCHPMLTEAARKGRRQGFRALLIEADALHLPVADGSFDAIAISFGFRNLANYNDGLRELGRVLKPGGTLAILEFSHPTNWLMRLAYGFYSKFFLPLVGSLLSGSREAYTYLPESIRRFPRAEQLRQMMQASGFEQTEFQLLTGGIAALHIGQAAHGSRRVDAGRSINARVPAG
jgi:demethylmenaquinone methyltransferase / 2-methoxy-6-polyprenyl-1,4-benzoquinol methylase